VQHVGSVVAVPELSVVVAHMLSCSAACGNLLDEESNSSAVLAGIFFFKPLSPSFYVFMYLSGKFIC